MKRIHFSSKYRPLLPSPIPLGSGRVLAWIRFWVFRLLDKGWFDIVFCLGVFGVGSFTTKNRGLI